MRRTHLLLSSFVPRHSTSVPAILPSSPASYLQSIDLRSMPLRGVRLRREMISAWRRGPWWRVSETIARDSSLGRAIVSPLRRTWALCTFLDRVQKRSEFQVPVTIIGDSKCSATVGLEFRVASCNRGSLATGGAESQRERSKKNQIHPSSGLAPVIGQWQAGSWPLNLGQLFFSTETTTPFPWREHRYRLLTYVLCW